MTTPHDKVMRTYGIAIVVLCLVCMVFWHWAIPATFLVVWLWFHPARLMRIFSRSGG